ncbi:MAG: 3-deoxy-7-phosphoheptulonate synthase [Candidatus Dormiibacterota bacterium]
MQTEDEDMLELEPNVDPAVERPRPVRIGSLTIGDGSPCLIAGPCSVEPGYGEHVAQLVEAGVDGLRANIFKPRTRPDSFQGLGVDGIDLLREAKRRTDLPLFTEVLGTEDAELVADLADCLWVGARNMQNFRLLEALGDIGKPVLLKRGMGATVDEWVGASEYIRRRGNDDVVLCERGIRTFESRTRNTLDVSAVVVARELTDLPVLVDPSHAAGNRDWVLPLGRAALAAGADGLLVEAHPEPEDAWSDGDQAIDLHQLDELVRDVRRASLRTSRLDLPADPSRPHLLQVLDEEIARLTACRARLAAGLGVASA